VSAPLQGLQEIIEKRSRLSEEWNRRLPVLRARSVATSVFLRELAAASSLKAPPQRDHVLVIIVPPRAGWIEDVLEQLQARLPKAVIGSEIYGGLKTPDGLALTRCQIRLRHRLFARYKVEEEMDGVAVDYSDCLKLLVAFPSEDS
jgi:hypothetical protein